MRRAAAAVLALTAGCIEARTYPEGEPPTDGPPIDSLALADHDEDGDGVDDALDNCPDVDNPDQADTVELQIGLTPDGIGDLCDPSKDLNGLLLFESFHRPLAGRWVDSGWTVADDAVRVVADSGMMDTLTSVTRFSGDVVVVAQVEVEISDSDGPMTTVEFSDQWDPDTATGGLCTLSAAASLSGPSILRVRYVEDGVDNTGLTGRDVAAAPLTPALITQISSTDQTGNQADLRKGCSVGGASATGATLPDAPGAIYLGIARGQLTVSSLAVYSRP